MRPSSSEALLHQGASPRPRKLSDPRVDIERPASTSSASPMMYFLADEAQVQASTSNFGVRSLEASVTDSELRRRPPPPSSTTSDEQAVADDDDDNDDDDGTEGDELSITSHDLLSSNPSPKFGMSQPMTPIIGPTDREDRPETPRSMSGQYMALGAPQLIMPEITMPSRRPFTEKGKRIGRLKILIAGDSGIGKSSLIKSIVQTCEDIVHVDPLGPPTGARHHTSTFNSRKSAADSESTKQITEVYASTRAYPHWWSEIDDSKILRRKSRSGFEEQVIERNLCFVDTPGYGSGTSFLECIEPVVRYVEGQFERTQAIINSGDGDLMALLSGTGTPHVDIVFYVVLHRLKPVDIEFIRRLSPYTSVLPVIAKSDTLTPQQVMSLKLSILNELRGSGIRPFLFGRSSADILRSSCSGPEDELVKPSAPFAISSVVVSDAENMDASVLMSPEYVPPLLDTELKQLVDQVFEPDNITWLKHATSKKFMSWRLANSTTSLVTTRGPGSLTPTSTPRRPSPGNSALLSHSTISVADSFALARVADHSQREERLAKIRLARWATDLEKSLRAEKERYERLARGERALWLTERLNECVMDGQLVAISPCRKGVAARNSNSQHAVVDTRDPFGLLRLNEDVGKNLIVMIKVAGIGGVIGVMGVWIYKSIGSEWVA